LFTPKSRKVPGKNEQLERETSVPGDTQRGVVEGAQYIKKRRKKRQSAGIRGEV